MMAAAPLPCWRSRVSWMSHKFQPAVDVYLAWFGGHEIGTYGSAYFVATHQELLDHTLAQVQMDGLGYPLDRRSSKITMMHHILWTFRR